MFNKKKAMSRPIRMKMFVCRFMIPNESGVGITGEISPIIAKEATHAQQLIWKHHTDFFAQHSVSSITIEELSIGSDIWMSNIAGYVGPDVRTTVPFKYKGPTTVRQSLTTAAPTPIINSNEREIRADKRREQLLKNIFQH